MAKRDAYPIGILLALCIAESTVTFETSMIFAAMPTLIHSFGNPFMAGQLVAVHPLIAAATAPVAGRLGDMRGRKPIILILLGLALLGSIISALSESFILVMLGRAMQGLSVTVLSLAVGVLRENLPVSRLPLSIGFLTAAQGVGAATGLILGGAIIDHFNWHWLFAASAVLIALSISAVWLFLPARKVTRQYEPIDWVEAILPMGGIAALMLAIGMTKQYGLVSPQVLGSATMGVIIITVWARRALAASEPFIDLRLFAMRNFAAVNAATLLLASGTMQIVYIFSTYIQSPRWTGVGLGLSATAAGFAKLPSHFLTVTAGPLASWLALRFGHRPTFVTACLLAATGWCYAISLPNHLIQIMILLCITSYGTTMIVTATTNVIVDTVPEDRTSEAVGTSSVIRSIGLAIGAQFIAISLSTFTVASPDGLSQFPSALSFQITMTWIAASSIGGMLITLLLRGGRGHAKAGPDIQSA